LVLKINKMTEQIKKEKLIRLMEEATRNAQYCVEDINRINAFFSDDRIDIKYAVKWTNEDKHFKDVGIKMAEIIGKLSKAIT